MYKSCACTYVRDVPKTVIIKITHGGRYAKVARVLLCELSSKNRYRQNITRWKKHNTVEDIQKLRVSLVVPKTAIIFTWETFMHVSRPPCAI